MLRKGLLANTAGVAFISLTILVSGCATIPPDERPEITLSALELTDATLFETTMVAKVRISNPSLHSIAVEGATFKLVLDGKKVGRGMMKEIVTVEGLESQVANAIFHINNASALLRFKDILEQRVVGYGIVGNLYLQAGSGTTKIKVEQSGQLDLNETFQIQESESIQVQELE